MNRNELLRFLVGRFTLNKKSGRLMSALGFGLILIACPMVAQGQEPSSNEALVEEGLEDLEKAGGGSTARSTGVSISADFESGGIVAKIDGGDDLFYSEIGSRSAFVLAIDLEGSWSSATEGDEYGSLRFQPTLAGFFEEIRDLEKVTNLARWHVFGDLRARYGKFPDDENQDAPSVNQFLVGLGLGCRIPLGKSDGLSLTARHYKVEKSDPEEAELPDSIVADTTQAELEFGYQASAGTYDLRFALKVTGSWPNGGDFEDLVDASIQLGKGGSSLSTVLTYRDGSEGGFDFDRQVLLGVALDFIGNSD